MYTKCENILQRQFQTGSKHIAFEFITIITTYRTLMYCNVQHWMNCTYIILHDYLQMLLRIVYTHQSHHLTH